MKEMKLRVWDEGLGRMIYFDLKSANDTVDCVIYEDTMLYTGGQDKNGNDIYEGDILGVKTRKRNKNYQFYHIVEYKELELYGGLWSGLGFDFPPLFIEIVGNIYENPDLASK